MFRAIKLTFDYLRGPEFDEASTRFFNKVLFVPSSSSVYDCDFETMFDLEIEDAAPLESASQARVAKKNKARQALKGYHSMLDRNFGQRDVRLPCSYAVEDYRCTDRETNHFISQDIISQEFGSEEAVLLHLMETADYACDCRMHRQLAYEQENGSMRSIKTKSAGAKFIADTIDARRRARSSSSKSCSPSLKASDGLSIKSILSSPKSSRPPSPKKKRSVEFADYAECQKVDGTIAFESITGLAFCDSPEPIDYDARDVCPALSFSSSSSSSLPAESLASLPPSNRLFFSPRSSPQVGVELINVMANLSLAGKDENWTKAVDSRLENSLLELASLQRMFGTPLAVNF